MSFFIKISLSAFQEANEESAGLVIKSPGIVLCLTPGAWSAALIARS